MAGNPKRLILFTRWPGPGRTKTRLIPRLGAEGAADLHRQMTEHVLSAVCRYTERHACDLEIRYTGGSRRQMTRWLGNGFLYALQAKGDIGRRMEAALEAAFKSGVQRAVLIGSDIPGITAAILEEAFEALHSHAVVFGPAQDGGYYLIGMQRAAASKALRFLFKHVPWGTESVLDQTLEIVQSLQVTAAFTEALRDVDRPEDLAAWEAFLRSSD